MPGLIQDVRLALRSLSKSPGFTAVVALSFALGIGGNALVFGLVDGFVLRPFPYPDPDRLVAIGAAFPRASAEQRFVEVLSPAEYADLRGSRTFASATSFDLGNRNLVGGEYPERVFTALVLDDPFPVIGLSPLLGRGFTREELRPGGPLVAILSHRLWRSKFGGDPSLVGRSLEVSGQRRTVVGIMPPGLLLLGTDLWIPWGGDDPAAMSRDARQFTVIARLTEGVRLSEANAELATLAAQVDRDHRSRFKEYEGWRLTAEPWASALLRGYRPAVHLLLGAVGFVLLVACANIASLLLARATTRQRDVAVRLALGASRWRIARQMLVETFLLAALGCGAGLFLADVGFEPIAGILPARLAALDLRASLDARVVGVSVALTLGSALLAAVLPVVHATRADVRDSLASDSRAATGGRGAERARRSLILGEIVIAVVLVAGAGLLIRSLAAIQRVDPGYDPRGVLTLRLTLPPTYREVTTTQFFRDLTDRVARLPGVRAAGTASQLPPMGAFGMNFQIEGRVETGHALPKADITVASREYLSALGVPLVSGRSFSAADGMSSPSVAIVNRAFFARYLADATPLGRRLGLGGDADRRWFEIVGVVADVRNQGLTTPTQPEIFVPMEQQAIWNQLFLLIRADADPRALLPLVRREVAALDPAQPVYAVQTLEDGLAETTFPQRAAMVLLAVFAAMAVALAAIGIYGLTSYVVDARKREFGIRMAVGADASAVARMVLWQVLRIGFAGAILGLGLAFVLGRAASALLFEVSPGDPLALGAAALSLGVVAAAAGFLPARRASRVDPSVALRHE